MDVARLVDPVLDLSGLRLPNSARDVERHRSGLGVRHQAARAEDASELAELTHLVRSGDQDIKVEPVFLDLRDVLGADVIGARGLGFARLVAGGND